MKNSKSRKYILYFAIKSAGRRYTNSLLVRYNANLDLRSFCYTLAEVSNSFPLRAISVLCLPLKWASCNC